MGKLKIRKIDIKSWLSPLKTQITWIQSSGICHNYVTEKTAVSAVCKGSSNMVVSYLFETITRRLNAYNETEDIVNYLYRGCKNFIYYDANCLLKEKT